MSLACWSPPQQPSTPHLASEPLPPTDSEWEASQTSLNSMRGPTFGVALAQVTGQWGWGLGCSHSTSLTLSPAWPAGR